MTPDPRNFRLYPLSQGFTEGTGALPADGAAWNTYDGTHVWVTAGGDYDSSTYVDARQIGHAIGGRRRGTRPLLVMDVRAVVPVSL